MKPKLKMSMHILAAIKKCLTLVIIQLSQKFCDNNSNKLVIGKMKDKTGDVTVLTNINMFV